MEKSHLNTYRWLNAEPVDSLVVVGKYRRVGSLAVVHIRRVQYLAVGTYLLYCTCSTTTRT